MVHPIGTLPSKIVVTLRLDWAFLVSDRGLYWMILKIYIWDWQGWTIASRSIIY